ncbi:uncharacterized protein K452DRAFT_300725 [Aplosporella prunicola CBS 121167]|uniref:Uncharacterized protein n=1 Tax=Aplosporella prunicola CBS 121167 TaxID=1176127 RepID=A0A6A6B560_9PEZI|nr:uncharacterized protein K452DRAFT_300725 [Aplosporella prunicola CBS 121167]KAF2139180.1 hypothetical protein K452DRAFT_300725 [Aplosporella prunicola CBS 121167]
MDPSASLELANNPSPMQAEHSVEDPLDKSDPPDTSEVAQELLVLWVKSITLMPTLSETNDFDASEAAQVAQGQTVMPESQNDPNPTPAGPTVEGPLDDVDQYNTTEAIQEQTVVYGPRMMESQSMAVDDNPNTPASRRPHIGGDATMQPPETQHQYVPELGPPEEERLLAAKMDDSSVSVSSRQGFF